MVTTIEHMKKIKFKTQSSKFMCGPMYNESRPNKVHYRKVDTCHNRDKYHFDSNWTRACTSKLEE